MGKAAKKATGKADPIVDRMDKLANDLIDKAEQADVTLQAKLDVFKECARWVSVKKGLGDPDDSSGALHDLQRRLRSAETPPRRGAARTPGKGGDHFNAAFHRRGIHYPDGDGGPALDALKRRVPGSDAGDDDGPVDGA